MTHLRIEQNENAYNLSARELVSGAIILKLYLIITDPNNVFDLYSHLKGYLNADVTYLSYIDTLTDDANDLTKDMDITANKVYINLLDSIFESKIALLFGDGTGITQLLILNVTNIGYNDFNGTNCVTADLTPFTNFTIMYTNMFGDCNNLLYVNTGNILRMGPSLPDEESFETYPYSLFGSCPSLNKIVCPNLQYVESGTFTNNSSIEEIYLPSIIKMAGMVFRNTNSLSFVYIGSSVTYIGLFFSLPAITNRCKVVIMATTPPSTKQGLDNGDNFHGLVDVYVPLSSLNTYKTNSEWSLIASHIYAIETDLPQLYKEKVNTELGLTIFTLS